MMNGTGNIGDGMGWSMGFSGFFMLLFWGLIIFGIFLIIKWLMGGAPEQLPKPKTALDILQERYARGEIDEQEYQQKRRELEQ